MTKVTITAQPEGNEPTKIPVRAEAILAAAQKLPAIDTLAAIITEARTFAAEIYEPAHTAFSNADEASVANKDPDQDEALSARATELSDIWLGHADTYEAIAARILDLPAADAQTAERHIRAYAELIEPLSGEGEADDPILRLRPDHQANVLSYLLDAIRGGDHGAPTPSASIGALVDAALEHKSKRFEPAFDKTSPAQERFYAARSALGAVPFPAGLMAPTKERHLISFGMRFSDGTTETKTLPPEMVRLESVETVMAYCDGDEEKAAPYLLALRPWLDVVEPLRARMVKADAAMRRAEARQGTASDELDEAILAILAAPAGTVADILAKAEGFSRARCDSINVEDLESLEDCAPALEAIVRDLRRLSGGDPSTSAAPAPKPMLGSTTVGTANQARWDTALREVREAEIARLHATSVQSDFEHKNPKSGDGDPEYDKLTAAWNDADNRFFTALHQLLAVPAPDVEALAHQIQAYGWLTDVTEYRIDGLTGWALDPACPKVAAAVDEAGDADERCLLSLYRSACALAGGIKIPPLRTELEPPQLLAAE